MLLLLIGLLAGLTLAEIHLLQKSSRETDKRMQNQIKDKLSPNDKSKFENSMKKREQNLANSPAVMIVKEDDGTVGAVKASGEVSFDKNDIEKAQKTGAVIQLPPPPPPLPNSSTFLPHVSRNYTPTPSDKTKNSSYFNKVLGQIQSQLPKLRTTKQTSSTVYPSGHVIEQAVSDGKLPQELANELNNSTADEDLTLEAAVAQRLGQIRGSVADSDEEDDDNEWDEDE